MTAPVCHVTFHGLPHSPALEQLIQERTTWLQPFAAAAVAVRAQVDVPHRHQHRHAMRIQLRIAIGDHEPITIEREGIGDTYALVRDAFDVARRRLQDAVRAQRGFVKTHPHAARRAV